MWKQTQRSPEEEIDLREGRKTKKNKKNKKTKDMPQCLQSLEIFVFFVFLFFSFFLVFFVFCLFRPLWPILAYLGILWPIVALWWCENTARGKHCKILQGKQCKTHGRTASFSDRKNSTETIFQGGSPCATEIFKSRFALVGRYCFF